METALHCFACLQQATRTPAKSSGSETFFLPKAVLAEVFRGKFVDGLKKAYAKRELKLHGQFTPLQQERAFKAFLRSLCRKEWVVEVRPPFGGAGKALEYLSRYTHRVAISNHRLVSFVQGRVTFRWRDSAHGNQQRLMTLELYEFLRRLMLHVLPAGFHRIRYYGFLHPRAKNKLAAIRAQLGVRFEAKSKPESEADRPAVPPLCPHCRKPMELTGQLTVQCRGLRFVRHYKKEDQLHCAGLM